MQNTDYSLDMVVAQGVSLDALIEIIGDLDLEITSVAEIF